MNVIWWRLRAELRTGRWSTAGVVAVIALAGALTLLGIAGAERTDSALGRQAAAAKVSDVALIPRSPARPSGPDFTLAEIRHLPEVRSAYAMPYLYFRARAASGRILTFDDLHLHDSPDPAVGQAVDRVKIVAGRRSDPNAADELMVSAPDAASLGLHVGSRLDVRFGSPAQEPGLSAQESNPAVAPDSVRYSGPRVTLRVVGLYAGLGTLAIDFGGPQPYRPALLTAAFYRRYHRSADERPLIFARLRGGLAAIPALARSLARMTSDGDTGYQPIGGATAQLQRQVDVDVLLLCVLAGLVAGLGALTTAQALTRRAITDAGEFGTLHALGMSRRQLLGLGVARAAGLGLTGAVLAVGLAIAASPLTPAGAVARLAEPHPGLNVNLVVLLPGAAAIVLAVILTGLPAAWQASRTPGSEHAVTVRGSSGDRRAVMLDPRLDRLPLSAALGAHMALPAGGRRRMATLAPTAVLALTVAFAASVISCGASFRHLTHSPSLYGQNWEFAVGGGGGGNIAATVERLRRDPTVSAVVPGGRTQVVIEGRTVGLLGLGQGAVGPTVIDGKAPSDAGQILLGRSTLASLHRRVGDTVDVSSGGHSTRMRIVALGVIPDLNETLRLGVGGLVTAAGLRRLDPGATDGYAFVRLRRVTPAAVAHFLQSYGAAQTTLVGLPADLENVEHAARAEPLIEVLLGAVAVLALLQTLGGAVRSSRRELTLLKTLGLVPNQLRAVVAWQATIAAFIALLTGIPVGILAGRWLWLLLADQLGVASHPVVPLGALALLTLVTLAVASLVALVPGASAARLRPAVVLRSE